MKTMFVTGATKNTGWAIARRFAAQGWNAVVSSRSAEAAVEAAAKLKAEFPQVETLGIGMDPAKVEDIRAAFAAIKAKFGGLDAFVNCAAHLGVGMSVLSTTPDDYDALMNANVRAPFFCVQEAVKLMKEGGSVTFISSCHAAKSVPGRICYTVSKAALGGMVRSLAVELGALGIRANAVLAGAIRTDRWDGLTPEQVQERRDFLAKIFGKIGEKCNILPPFKCDYGFHIEVGENFFANYNFIVLDGNYVRIGDNVWIAPNVGIYAAGHPLDVKDRIDGWEYAYPVTIGNNVWIGGSSTILGGVTIGDNSVIGAGSVVTRDIPENTIAFGNPCRPHRKINEKK